MQVEPKQNQLQPWGPVTPWNGTIPRAVASASCDGTGPLYSRNGTCVHWCACACVSCYVHAMFIYVKIL